MENSTFCPPVSCSSTTCRRATSRSRSGAAACTALPAKWWCPRPPGCVLIVSIPNHYPASSISPASPWCVSISIIFRRSASRHHFAERGGAHGPCAGVTGRGRGVAVRRSGLSFARIQVCMGYEVYGMEYGMGGAVANRWHLCSHWLWADESFSTHLGRNFWRWQVLAVHACYKLLVHCPKKNMKHELLYEEFLYFRVTPFFCL